MKSPTPFHGRLGETVPDFTCETTHGSFSFHSFLKSTTHPWTLLLSHPADFTPVCTTELGASEKGAEELSKLGVKLIGISCDSVDTHHAWEKDIMYREGMDKPLSFPLIADRDREIVTALGMLDQSEKTSSGLALPARAVYLLDHFAKLRMAIVYPTTTGRDYNEIVRVCESIILTDRTGLATPVNWTRGQPVLVPVNVTTEAAELMFGPVRTEKLPSGRDYIRHVKCPPNV